MLFCWWKSINKPKLLWSDFKCAQASITTVEWLMFFLVFLFWNLAICSKISDTSYIQNKMKLWAARKIKCPMIPMLYYQSALSCVNRLGSDEVTSLQIPILCALWNHNVNMRFHCCLSGLFRAVRGWPWAIMEICRKGEGFYEWNKWKSILLSGIKAKYFGPIKKNQTCNRNQNEAPLSTPAKQHK